jgi:hypothetical protein
MIKHARAMIKHCESACFVHQHILFFCSHSPFTRVMEWAKKPRTLFEKNEYDPQ